MLIMFYIVNIQERVDMSSFQKSHVMCSVCGTDDNNYYSLGVKFSALQSNSVQSYFVVLPRHQGYLGLLHGGIASSLLDAAMTHCLFHQKVAALTAQLDVRYHYPIKVNEEINIVGELLSTKRGVYFLKAELRVGEQVRVSGKGKFIAFALEEGTAENS